MEVFAGDTPELSCHLMLEEHITAERLPESIPRNDHDVKDNTVRGHVDDHIFKECASLPKCNRTVTVKVLGIFPAVRA